MNFIKIEGLKDVYPEPIEGTDEWYYCKIAKNCFCDLYEAEEIVKKGFPYEGMECVLIHYPDGKVYRPFSIKKNMYVDAPVFWQGALYALMVDLTEKQMQIVTFGDENNRALKDGQEVFVNTEELKQNEIVKSENAERNAESGVTEFIINDRKWTKRVLAELSLDEVDDCYNLKLHVAPVLLVREGHDGVLEIVWPEKKKIKMGSRETFLFWDGENLYFSKWYEDPNYREKILVRDWNTGEIKETFAGQMRRMPNGDVCVIIMIHNIFIGGIQNGK